MMMMVQVTAKTVRDMIELLLAKTGTVRRVNVMSGKDYDVFALETPLDRERLADIFDEIHLIQMLDSNRWVLNEVTVDVNGEDYLSIIIRGPKPVEGANDGSEDPSRPR